jgi:hypothetical protein
MDIENASDDEKFEVHKQYMKLNNGPLFYSSCTNDQRDRCIQWYNVLYDNEGNSGWVVIRQMTDKFLEFFMTVDSMTREDMVEVFEDREPFWNKFLSCNSDGSAFCGRLDIGNRNKLMNWYRRKHP